jgi:hypothetical protein
MQIWIEAQMQRIGTARAGSADAAVPRPEGS